MLVETCVQKFRELTDRRFCFELGSEDRFGFLNKSFPSSHEHKKIHRRSTIVLQATSEADRRSWMAAMGGLEPVKTVRRKKKNVSESDAPAVVPGASALSSPQEISGPGFVFVRQLTAYVERNFTDYEVSPFGLGVRLAV
jgi:hypothetical protein